MKKYIITILLISFIFSAYAQLQEETSNYRRSSLYSMLIAHPSQKFHKDITEVFFSIPIPEKFNNHDLSVKVVSSDEKKQEKLDNINDFIVRNALARRMMSKWFDRDPETGYFDMHLIASRGNYDATYFDVELAKQTVRGVGQLADAGEELIGNTFLIVNDIKYVDKSTGAKIAGDIFKLVGAVASEVAKDTVFRSLGNDIGDLVSTIKGFKVTVTSYLYRLEWNDEVAGTLYQSYYMTENDSDPQRKKAFENNNQLFRLKYIGKQSVNSGKTSIEGVNLESPEQMIRKVCTRAIDKSIAELQRTHEEFRVKTPIFSVAKTVKAKIGMKEGVTSGSKFEVLEQSMDKDGRTQYKRVGVIKPVGKIWDNRYMAAEEKSATAHLAYTEFKKVSGSDFYPGMLIREIK
ncbi:MAG: hypothetical protein FWC34_06335 [Bacteroidetes bacterium]|nr:hypothetical protein [Bacteroidota bacterium]MCL2303347.1 hypothetical protein [Lentimicrobiaceae bacterium]